MNRRGGEGKSDGLETYSGKQENVPASVLTAGPSAADKSGPVQVRVVSPQPG